jgi:hypothetical protein
MLVSTCICTEEEGGHPSFEPSCRTSCVVQLLLLLLLFFFSSLLRCVPSRLLVLGSAQSRPFARSPVQPVQPFNRSRVCGCGRVGRPGRDSSLGHSSQSPERTCQVPGARCQAQDVGLDSGAQNDRMIQRQNGRFYIDRISDGVKKKD